MVTPDQRKRFNAYLDAVARAKPPGTAPTFADLWNAKKYSMEAPAAPTGPVRKNLAPSISGPAPPHSPAISGPAPGPEVQRATPIEAPPHVPATTPLLGLTQAAQLLGCHRRTVRAYIRAGLLPGLFLAGRWKIRREDLEAFIEGAPRSRNESRTVAPVARSDER